MITKQQAIEVLNVAFETRAQPHADVTIALDALEAAGAFLDPMAKVADALASIAETYRKSEQRKNDR